MLPICTHYHYCCHSVFVGWNQCFCGSYTMIPLVLNQFEVQWHTVNNHCQNFNTCLVSLWWVIPSYPYLRLQTVFHNQQKSRPSQFHQWIMAMDDHLGSFGHQVAGQSPTQPLAARSWHCGCHKRPTRTAAPAMTRSALAAPDPAKWWIEMGTKGIQPRKKMIYGRKLLYIQQYVTYLYIYFIYIYIIYI